MSSRVGLHILQQARLARAPTLRRPIGRRYQVTDASTPAAPQSLFQKLWTSPVGLKTVHFWAPIMKWGIVLTGVSDFWRPAEKLSLTQNMALTATGAIWTRWCLIIKPRNILLATVNFFLGCVGVVQVSRILVWQRSVKNEIMGEVVKENAVDVGKTAIDAAKDVGEKAKAMVK